MEGKLKSKVSVMAKPEKSYGHLNLSSKDFPEVKDFTLAKEVELTVKFKIKTLRNPDRWEVAENKMNPKDVMASGEICDIKFAASK